MIENFEIFKKDLREASKLGKNIKLNSNTYDSIVFCGIGGSAAPGEIVKALCSLKPYIKKPIEIVREELPMFTTSKTLCFVISYSGNTRETIHLYKKAKEKKCKIIIITSGGKLSKFKEEKILIPQNYLPREAFVWLTFPVLNILKIPYDMKNIQLPSQTEISKIVKKIKNKIPLVYSSSEAFRVVAYRWKISFNETSKAPAFSNYFPELAHNEIEALIDKKFQPILLIDKKTEQIDRSIKYLSPLQITLKGKDKFSKIIYGIYLGFLVSYQLAKLLKRDPNKTPRLESLKLPKKS